MIASKNCNGLLGTNVAKVYFQAVVMNSLQNLKQTWGQIKKIKIYIGWDELAILLTKFDKFILTVLKIYVLIWESPHFFLLLNAKQEK